MSTVAPSIYSVYKLVEPSEVMNTEDLILDDHLNLTRAPDVWLVTHADTHKTLAI